MTLTNHAVVDTGFWTLSCRLNIAHYLTHIWDSPIWMPGAVLAEVFAQPVIVPPSVPSTWGTWGPLYQDQAEFLTAFVRGTLRPVNPSRCVTNQFHSGEQAALDVAQELGASLLINEQKAHQYAVSLGLDAVSVPEYLVILVNYPALKGGACENKPG